jgi:hypothetical protein
MPVENTTVGKTKALEIPAMKCARVFFLKA